MRSVQSVRLSRGRKRLFHCNFFCARPEIEAETENDAIYLSVSEWVEPVKSTPTKSDIIEVTKL